MLCSLGTPCIRCFDTKDRSTWFSAVRLGPPARDDEREDQENKGPQPTPATISARLVASKDASRPSGCPWSGLNSVTVIPRHRGSEDRKSTRLNSSHVKISYAVFC